MNVRMTMFFGQYKWGWTETWYWVGASLGLEAAEQDAKQLGIYRRALMDSAVSLEGIRLTVVNEEGRGFNAGVSEIKYGSITDGPGRILTAHCNNPWTSLYLRFYAPGKEYARNLLLRGIPDDFNCIETGIYSLPYTIPTKLKKPLETFTNYICNNSRSLQVVAPPSGFDFNQNKQNSPTGDTLLQPIMQSGGAGGIPLSPAPKLIFTPQGSFAFTPVNKVGAKATPRKLVNVAIDPLTSRMFIDIEPQFTLTKGDRIHLHGLRSDGKENVNGDTRVAGPRSTAAGVVGYYPLTRVLKDGCGLSDTASGVWWPVKKMLASPLTCEVGRVVRKSTGAVHFGTAGAAPRGRSNKQR